MITKRDLAFAVSRLLAVYLCFQLAMLLIEVPTLVSSMLMVRRVSLSMPSHYAPIAPRFSIFTTTFLGMLLRAIFYGFNAILFWKCGPGVERLFTRADE